MEYFEEITVPTLALKEERIGDIERGDVVSLGNRALVVRWREDIVNEHRNMITRLRLAPYVDPFTWDT